jgi:rod shape-determining protein MreC
VGLELVCTWLIVTQNIFLSASFFNSSNQTVAGILTSSNSISNYFSLAEVNDDLSQQNALLQKRLRAYEQSLYRLDTRLLTDSDLIGQYDYLSAKIINNSTRNVHNHITINIGKKQGMTQGLGVVNQRGIVGKIASVSDNYSVISSLLNADLMVSSMIKRTGQLGTTNWSGKDANQANLLYIPRHVKPLLGDTIITSGYNAIYPEGVLIGTIEDIILTDEANFYEIVVNLANDYGALSHVFVIKNNLKIEQQSTEAIVTGAHD